MNNDRSERVTSAGASAAPPLPGDAAALASFSGYSIIKKGSHNGTHHDGGGTMAQVVRAGIKDHGNVTTLLMEFIREEGWELEVDRDLWDKTVAQLLHSDRWLFLMSLDDGEPVALAVVFWFITLRGTRDQGRLMAIYVDPDRRRGGVGSELLGEVMSYARRRGCREIEVRTGVDDERVASFYRKTDSGLEERLFVWRCD